MQETVHRLALGGFMTLRLQSFGLSDIGLTRPNNEDVWTALPEIGFFAIADGMGGHQSGEIAAQKTIDQLSLFIQEMPRSDCLTLVKELKRAIEKTNFLIHRLSKQKESLQGMGTTLCCLLWTNEAIIYAHVGDSRIYRLRNQKLELLTQDHSLFAKWLATGKLAEECETPFPYKNVITRAIGTSERVQPEIAVATAQPGDLFFLCTDGLTDVLDLNELEKILNDTADLEKACKILIEKAKMKGSSDNITVLLIQNLALVNGKNQDLFRQQRDDFSRSESLQSHAD